MKKLRKILAVVLCLAMLTGIIQITSVAADERTVSSLPFMSVSDIHYYPESLMGNKTDAWLEFCRLDSKMYNESEQILRTGLDTMVARAKKQGVKYILVPGDLTKDSEYEAHVGLAAIFEEYQEKYGVQFLVINGNHDVNTTKACTFENDKKESARAITAAEFPQVYAKCGYADAVDRYAYPEKGDKISGALSYVYDLDDNYRLIVVDSCKYSFDEPGKDETGGNISPELMSWIKSWADKSKEDGKVPFLMIHHNMAPHMKVEPSITFAFPLEDYLSVSEQFASWGINYTFSGHLHTNDIASVTNDDGETLYDFETASITGYPNTYRENVISTKANGETSMGSSAVDFDDVAKMTFDGITYDNNTYKYKAFDLCFGGGISDSGKADVTAFLVGIVKNYAGSYITQINEAGGIVPFLKTMGIDLEQILSDFLYPYIGNGFKIGSYNIFSVDNLMWFINDLCDQISDLYLKDPEKLYALLTDVVDELMSMQMSDLPCTKFIGTLGFGNASKPGTLGDVVLSAMSYWYTGNEDISDDAFIKDVIDKFENGDSASKLFYKLIDLVLHDLLEDGILSKLEIRVDKLLSDTKIQKKMGEGINYLLYYVLKGNFSYMNLVDTVFALGVLPYKDLYDVLDQLLLKKYLTDSQLESIGIFIAYVLSDFATDENPRLHGDSGVTYTNSVVKAEATQENYRLPTMVSVTMGEDSQTQATVNWFSKYSLDGDIEIYKADSEPTFTGVPTTDADFTISKESKTVTRSYPGIDLGIIGLFQYAFEMKQHTVTLSDLEPGSTYYYRVGNAKYGWWSETGKITTADGSKNVTFFHMTDPQSQNTRQYNRAWKNVLNTAFNLYPDADFIVNTGDLVDHGDNNKQWQYMFDCGADTLMNTYMMPVSGNHEAMGTNATANYFVLPNMPKQDTTSGVYYSYDYNNVHIAVLNTNELEDDDSLSKEQIEWLTKDMKSSDAQWKFVALHKAIYSQGSHYDDDDVCALRTQLSALMPTLDIDMVFQGHDHVYMRTSSIINNEKADVQKTYLIKDGNYYKTQVQPEGTSYVITGCSGVKSYIANDTTKTDKYFPRAEKIYSVDCPMFAAVQIEDGVLYFDAYTVKDGEATAVDRFAIQKDTTQGEVAADYEEAEEEDNENSATSFLKTLIEYILKVFKIVWNIFAIYIVGIDVKKVNK
ncbi:MAG: metallophosphoesterase [Acutalibacteraceae bacterium]